MNIHSRLDKLEKKAKHKTPAEARHCTIVPGNEALSYYRDQLIRPHDSETHAILLERTELLEQAEAAGDALCDG
jgi:hypothetical protein